MFKRLCLGVLLLAGLVLSFNGCNTDAPSGLTTIVISPATVTVELAPPGYKQGQSQFTAIGYYGHAGHQATQDITSQVTWSSSGSQIAGINSTGLATATGFDSVSGLGWVGSTSITASAPGFNGQIVSNTATFNVTACTLCVNTDVSTVTIFPGSQSVASLGVPVQFVALGKTVSGDTVVLTGAPGISWVSSVPTVAAMSTTVLGQATTAGAGSTTITATYTNPLDGTGASGSANLTVAPAGSPEPLTSVTVSPTTQTSLAVGQTVQFLAIATTGSGTFVNLTNQNATVNGQLIKAATWTSSNQSVATIDPVSGIATSKAAGVTVITAVATNTNDGTIVSGTATYTVTVAGSTSSEPLVSIAIQPSAQTSTSIGAASNVNFIAIGTLGSGGTVLLSNAIQTINGQTINPVSWLSSNPSVASFANSTVGTATPNAAGATAITAVVTNPDKTQVTATVPYTVTTTSTSTEPLTAVTIYPPSPSVSTPNESSQLLAIGSFSAAPTTQDVTTGLANPVVTTNWSSSDLGVATVATVPTACPAPVKGAISCTLSACPKGSTGETCTTCAGTNTSASGIYCATSNLVTPVGTVTGVNKGSSVIMAISANKDGTLVPASTTFSVLGGSTETYTALTIYPGSQSATAPAQQSQFIVLGTEGTTGMTYDVTNLVQWCSSNPTIATIGSTSTIPTTPDCANDNAPMLTPPILPELDPATPGVATALASGSTNITAIYTNPNGSGQVIASVGYSVTIGAAPEPLISINVIPGSITVTNVGQSAQYLAFGTYSTTPTVRDLTDKVTWYSSSSEVATIESSGTSGETGGVATAMGYTGNAVIYAFGMNPDGTVVTSNAVTFTCKDEAGICEPTPAPVLLATLTAFNSGSVYDTGENQTSWLITAPDDQGKPNLIHCGPGSEIAGLGNSVCTGTYASGSTATLTAWLADPATGKQIPIDNTFGGWSSNCGETVTKIPFTVTSVTFGASTTTIIANNEMSGGEVGVFEGLTGNAAVLNGLEFMVSNPTLNSFQITYPGATPGGPYTTTGTFTITTVVSTPDLSSTCSLPIDTNISVGAIFYSLSLSCPATTSGTVNKPFSSGTIAVSNGTGPDTFSVVGTLPAGLTLNTLSATTASVTGTPTAKSGSGAPFVPGPFYITATDANGTQASAASACGITIN
ncbi:MAG: hypothetical protein WAN35_16540 [Terracidiphilus sp.]